MATIKSFTDISQSKKLAEILPFESADAFYIVGKKPVNVVSICGSVTHQHLREQMAYKRAIPCWSLAALLSVLPNKIGRYYKTTGWFDGGWYCNYMDEDSECIYTSVLCDNPIDACYEKVLKLHELNLL